MRNAIILSIAALAGCAAVPPETRMGSAPSVHAEPRVSLQRWWTAFGDAELERLIEEALAHNVDLEAALARVREAQAVLDHAGGAQQPGLELQARSGRARKLGIESGEHRVSLEAAYEIDLWGRLSSATGAAREQLLSAQWARSALEWSLSAQLAESYFGLAAVERQIDISEKVRELRRAMAELRRREYEAGAGNEFELRRAQSELDAVEANIAVLERERAALERAVLALLGSGPSAGISRRPLDESRRFEVSLPAGAAAELLTRRPDVRQAEAELEAANFNLAAARAASLPSLALSGSLGSDARAVSDLFSGPAAIWAIGANVAQALFDGGRNEARWRQEHARAEQALAGYRKSIAGALLDVQEAYAALQSTQRALQAQRERVESLARAHELARRGFEQGALSRLDLIDAERNWYQAQLDQVAAYRDRLVGQVSAYKALGGGPAGAL